ncbi:MAG TPA: ATP-binding protein [Candidatus Pelethenecus sp.]|nr:ATP-binding protein [Candidatus Pelethenecus sp.]
MSEFQDLIPPAKSLITGIRAIGYSFPTAVADIIDNSITAKATIIDMISDPLAEEPYFAIFDNGYGMNRNEMLNAMTFGSDRENKVDCEQDLGRFGLGLKSASLSQCKKFYVVSKKYRRINAMYYDLEIIEKTNEWKLGILSDNEIQTLPCVDMLANIESGTIVIWTNFDKLEGAANNFEDSFRNIVAETKKHVEFVFHRFWKSIQIEFNHKLMEERDPFLTASVGRQQTGRTSKISVDGEIITVTPYSLPYANSLTTEEKRLLGNPKSIYDDQGFYVYRNKRLIYWGSWMYMGYKSELNKLARVQVDIPSSLDALWMLDVKKSYAKIPDKIKDQVRIAVEDSVVKSRKVVKYPGLKEQSEKTKVWDRIKNSHDGSVKYVINRNNPAIIALNESIGKAEQRIFAEVLNQIECYLPKFSLVNDSADAIKISNTGEDREEDVLIEGLINILSMFPYADRVKKLDEALQIESYKNIKNKRAEILEKI